MNRRQKTEFGIFLVEQIRLAGMSQEEFYNAVGIKKPYFYDLLTAAPPPTDLQNKMLAVLDDKTGSDPERRNKFYNLAASGRKEVPADIVKLILDHPDELTQIRITLASILQHSNSHANNNGGNE